MPKQGLYYRPSISQHCVLLKDLLMSPRKTKGTSFVAQSVNNLPAKQETWVRFLSRENPLEKEMASHSSILSWRIDGQRSLAGYTVHGVAIVGHNLATPPLKTKI